MASRHIIVDAGPLAALVDNLDQWHSATVSLISELPKPFFTCESVISEACHLLKKARGGNQKLMALVLDGMVKLNFSLVEEFEPVKNLMRKYEDVPMSLADGCLVRMTELVRNSSVFTFDTDFQIYRRNRAQSIETIPEYKK